MTEKERACLQAITAAESVGKRPSLAYIARQIGVSKARAQQLVAGLVEAGVAKRDAEGTVTASGELAEDLATARGVVSNHKRGKRYEVSIELTGAGERLLHVRCSTTVTMPIGPGGHHPGVAATRALNALGDIPERVWA